MQAVPQALQFFDYSYDVSTADADHRSKVRQMRKSLFLLLLVVTACVTVRQISIEPVKTDAKPDSPVVVESPVKAHLADGSTVVFPKGVTVQGRKVRGEGFKYDITLDRSEPVTEIDVDDIAAMESFTDDVNKGASIAATTVTTVAGGYAAMGLAKVIFGSCPTTYALEADELILEAESFSYSIAPGFEARDVDRLGIQEAGQQNIVLEMRNEALETHYINHVELLEVTHAHGEYVYPDVTGYPIGVRNLISANYAVDRDGNNIVGIEKGRDGSDWVTSHARLDKASLNDLHDYVELEFQVAPSDARHALILRVRNSLLNTVLLYDVMLKGQGFGALDWMVQDLDKVLPRLELASWYRTAMGMDVMIWDGEQYQKIAKIDDTGPIAWNEIAVPIPPVTAGVVRLRLQFVADNWHIDQVSLADLTEQRAVRAVPLSSVVATSCDDLPDIRTHLQRVDDEYVITRPADSMRLHFDVGEPAHGMTRTWFLAAEGYYIEWMRREWLENSVAQEFRPNDEAIMAAIELWKPRRKSLRQQFESTKIRVR